VINFRDFKKHCPHVLEYMVGPNKCTYGIDEDDVEEAVDEERRIGPWCFPYSCPYILGTVELGHINFGERTTQRRGEVLKTQLSGILQRLREEGLKREIDRTSETMAPSK
jgi:hypothetical protein